MALLTGLVVSAGMCRSPDAYTVYGSGLSECSGWLEDRRSGPEWFQAAQWVLGWVTAAGHFRSELQASDSKRIVAWIDDYCAGHPGDDMNAVALALIEELARAQPETETRRTASPLVRDVQSALEAAGYHPGPIDGLIGPRTRRAIRAYQADRGLPVDGEASGALLDQLHLAPHFIRRSP